MTTILLLALGATLGATTRYYVNLWSLTRFGLAFPYGTLIVNIVGSFILGGFLTLATGRLAISPELRLLVTAGFCGSLTTFSTFSYETVALLTGGSYLSAALNILANVTLSIAAVILGSTLARALLP